jgi:hypothetical protein
MPCLLHFRISLTSTRVGNRSVEDIRTASKVLLGKLHSKVPIPYRDEIALSMKGKKLKFGYYLSGMSIYLENLTLRLMHAR